MSSDWPIVRLGDVCEILDSKRKPVTKSERVPGDIPYYGASGVQDYVADYLFDEPLVLLGEDGAKWRAGDVSAFMISGKSWVNNHAHVLRPMRELVLDEWLTHLLVSSDLSDFITGVTVPKLNQAKMREIEIPLPPLDEQKRIVAKLDQTLGYVDGSITKIKASLIQCDCYLGAHLDNLLDFKDVPNDDLSLAKVTSKIGSGATPKGGHQSYKESGISLIRSMNVHDLRFKLDQLAFLDEEQAAQLNNVTVQDVDVLLNITGASVARTCVVPNEVLPARVNQHVAIVRPLKEILLSDFLAIQLASPRNKYRLLGIGEESGSTRQALTKAMIENFKIQIPTEISQQRRILAAYDSVTSLVTELRQNLMNQLSELEALRASILSAAFAGDL